MIQKIKRYAKKLYKALVRVEMGMLPASLAYNFVLAIIPILTLIILISSSFHISIDSVINLVQSFLPDEVSTYIIEAISGKGIKATKDGSVFIGGNLSYVTEYCEMPEAAEEKADELSSIST